MVVSSFERGFSEETDDVEFCTEFNAGRGLPAQFLRENVERVGKTL